MIETAEGEVLPGGQVTELVVNVAVTGSAEEMQQDGRARASQRA